MSKEYCPNGHFEMGLTHWYTTSQAQDAVQVVEADMAPAAQVLVMDNRSHPGWLQVKSEPFPISPLRRYAFSANVERITGEWGYNIFVSWLDEQHQFISYEYILMGALVGNAWKPYRMECLAPEQARFAEVVISIPEGWACRITNVSLVSLPALAPELAIELLPDLIRAETEKFLLKIRLENRGESVLESLHLSLTLPHGVTDRREDSEQTAIKIPRLAFAEVATFIVPLAGVPINFSDLLFAEVKGLADGHEVVFTATTTAFSSHALEITTPATALNPPALPDMKVRLGAYYFPVMLDWDRNNWGVRPVEYLEPLLGYYDEALPEVADWHIYWAVNHGLEFFVFDWYFNQGMHYLNDALEKGFLKSRFKDQMKFCVDWCNEGHCGQFKPVDFSDKSLNDFITTLCERYFIHDNYLRIEDKPVVLIHVPVKIANAHGGWDGCKAALERMRETARRYGHPDVFFIAVQNNTPFLLPYRQGGFDGITPYAYGFRDQIRDPVTDSLSYEALMPLHRECFRKAKEEAEAQGLLYIPTAWVGWDDAGRKKNNSVHTRGNSPANFRRMMEMLPEFVDNNLRFALFESWNEWGEGGEAEPGIQYRFERLSAIRDILSKTPGPYEIAIPTKEDVARFDTPVTWHDVEEIYLSRYARELGLHKRLLLDFEDPIGLRMHPSGTISDLRIGDNVLSCTSTGNNPLLTGPPWMGLPADEVTAIELRMRVGGGTTGRLYWITNEVTNWSEALSFSFNIVDHEKFHTYTLPVSTHEKWLGMIRQIRIIPIDSPGEIYIDYIKSV